MPNHVQTYTGFHACRTHDNPIDTLTDAAAVANMLDCLIAENNDLGALNGATSAKHGLCLVLGGIADAINDAVAALDRRDDEAGEDEAAVDDVKKILGRPMDELPTMGGLVRATMRDNMTAREAAIATVHGMGYGLEDIAKAVNLKKITVQRIIDQLDGKAAPAPDPVEQGAPKQTSA